MKNSKSYRRVRNRRINTIFILLILNITIYYYLISLDYNLISHNSIKTSSANYEMIPQICSDGSGGAFITSERYDVCYAQYVNSSGDLQWEERGILINPDVVSQYYAYTKIISDDVGGSIIATLTDENWNVKFLVMRLNSSGDIQWEVDTIPINSVPYGGFQICSDGANGVIISWSFGYNVYAQRINSSGDIQWGESSIVICDDPDDQEALIICSDGNGGAIIAWEDDRGADSSTDIYAQRINASGDIQWNENGVVVCIADNYQGHLRFFGDGYKGSLQICSDNANGVIIVWEDCRNRKDNY